VRDDEARLDAQNFGERVTCSCRPFTVETFERRASVHEGQKGLEQSADLSARDGLMSLAHRCNEPVATSRVCFDVGRPAGLVAERAAEGADDLHEAVIGDGGIAPGSLDDRVLRHKVAGALHENEEDRHLPRGQYDVFQGTGEPSPAGVELIRSETKDSGSRDCPLAEIFLEMRNDEAPPTQEVVQPPRPRSGSRETPPVKKSPA